MGSTPSKAARKLPRETPSGHQVGSPRVPATTPKPVHLRHGRDVRGEDKAIEWDAKNPHLTEKLSQLGPVRVDRRMQIVRATGNRQNTHDFGMQPDAEGPSPKNRLLASSLAELLEARKSISNKSELEALAERYHFDASRLEQISRVVSTPSIDGKTVVGTTKEHDEASLTAMACWIDPAHPH